jgi:hypothetical protein
MIRFTLPAALVALTLSPPAALAQAPSAPPDDSRYSFTKVDDGYLRLDGRTGQVSICSKKTLGWACETVADERAALESEIARLQAGNAELKKELISRGIALPRSADQQGSSTLREDRKLLDQADIDRVMTFMEKVWRRLSDMLGTLQKEIPGRT